MPQTPCGLFWKGGEGSCSWRLSGRSPAANLAELSSPGQQELVVRRPPAGPELCGAARISGGHGGVAGCEEHLLS